MMIPREPETPEDWQITVDASAFLLSMERLKAAGLVEGGSPVDTERAQELLDHGAALGYVPGDMERICRMFLRKKSTGSDNAAS